MVFDTKSNKIQGVSDPATTDVRSTHDKSQLVISERRHGTFPSNLNQLRLKRRLCMYNILQKDIGTIEMWVII